MISAGRAAGWVARSCAVGQRGAGPDSTNAHGDEEFEDERALPGEDDPGNIWNTARPACLACGGGRGNYTGIRPSARPAQTLRGEHGGGFIVRWPVTRQAARDGQPLATLRAGADPATWMLPGRGWWPRPRQVGREATMAVWRVAGCDHFGQRYARQLALGDLEPGTELTVTWNPSPSYAKPLAAAWRSGSCARQTPCRGQPCSTEATLGW